LKTKREIQAKTDIDWLRLFLDIVEPQTDRKATFYSAFAIYDPVSKKSMSFLGTTTGEIVDFPAAPIEKGIPVSAVFCPDGEIDVYSAMSKKKKTIVSHRGKAAKKLIQYLKAIHVSS
jgi:XTP/dITP diphosphohydrolase